MIPINHSDNDTCEHYNDDGDINKHVHTKSIFSLEESNKQECSPTCEGMSITLYEGTYIPEHAFDI